MLSKLFEDKRTHFRHDEGSGGGWDGDDPFDHDDYLAALFKQALGRSYGSLTPNPPRLIESVNEISKRLDQVGHLTILVSRDLQPIAKRLMSIEGYSDKRNPIILQDRFKDFDLSVE